MTAPELKPCPFCGGEALISKDHDPDGNGAFYAVKCRKCRAKSPEIYAVETCNIHFAQVKDAWNRRADLAAVPAQVRVKPLVFDWHKDEDSPNPSCWRAKGDGYHAYVLIPFDAGCDPAVGVGTWNANPNHRGQTGFKSREDAMAYCETSISNQAEKDLRRAMWAIATWCGEPQPDPDCCLGLPATDCADVPSRHCVGPQPDPRDEVIARLVEALENRLHDPECPCNACEPMLAALAAAKAV